MSLNFDHGDVQDKDFIFVPAESVFGEGDTPLHLAGEKIMNPRFEAVIFATMAVDIGEITEKNKVEFYLRYLLWNRVVNCEPKPYLQFSDIEKSVGLKTNVFFATNAAFKRDTWERAQRIVEQQYRENN